MEESFSSEEDYVHETVCIVTCCICEENEIKANIVDKVVDIKITESEFRCYSCKSHICKECKSTTICQECVPYYPYLSKKMTKRKNSLENFFKERLCNDKLNKNATDWVNEYYYRNFEVKSKYYADDHVEKWLFSCYLDSFLEKHQLGQWQNSKDLPYDKIVKILRDMGFNPNDVDKKAKYVRSAIDEFLDPKDDGWMWGHEPSLLFWI